jgi:CubicO group peptidase (beta-lactamase class C family)
MRETDKATTLPIHGTIAPGFEAVQAEFVRNFTRRGEVGAACIIYHQDHKVVDLWGGYRDEQTHAPWEEDTMVIVYSTTEGIVALTMALAHLRGLFDYDVPVAMYWPEFAQQGKEQITVRQLLSHQVGLSVIDEPVTVNLMADPDALAAILARQKPVWEPGKRQGYHVFSLGWYASELLRRVDPQHRTLGQFFQDEQAKPLDLEFYIGVPASVSTSRIATPMEEGGFQRVFMIPPELLLSMLNPGSITMRTLRNPKVNSNLVFNSPEYRAVEFPSAGGIGQASSIARAYSVFANGGHELGLTSETLATLKAPALSPADGRKDLVLHTNISFSVGFLKPFSGFRFGSNEKAFGTAGSGGSFGFADPDAQVGYAYVMNKQMRSVATENSAGISPLLYFLSYLRSASSARWPRVRWRCPPNRTTTLALSRG